MEAKQRGGDKAASSAEKTAPVAESAAPKGTTIVIEGGPKDERRCGRKGQPRRLNPIKQKQMEERCGFLEEEIPRVEAAIAHTEEQLGRVCFGRGDAAADGVG